MPCDYKKYPKNWKEIRKRILERDNYSCKICGIDNYAGVKWDKKEKQWIRACGNILVDEVGEGLRPYAMAKSCVDHWNETEEEGKWIVIVLTIMHLDHDTTNNTDQNLAAACQRCHLAYDQKLHRENSKATRNKKKGLQSLF